MQTIGFNRKKVYNLCGLKSTNLIALKTELPFNYKKAGGLKAGIHGGF